MLTVGELGRADFEQRLMSGGVTLHWGPFSSRVVVRLPELVDPLRTLYGDCVVSDEPLADFHALLRPPCSLAPQACWRAEFLADGERVLGPSPRPTALAMFEWGLNWCVYSSAHQFLMLHAAVVAKDDEALVLPGAPGSGKSTLTAALVADGWRLLSDELALIEPATNLIRPLARPISLKNESIDVAQRLLPSARFGPTVKATAKGRLALMSPPAEAVRRSGEPARCRWIVFPRYGSAEPLALAPVSQARALMALSEQALNDRVHGEAAFRSLRALVDDSACFTLAFGDVVEAAAALDELERPDRAARAEALAVV